MTDPRVLDYLRAIDHSTARIAASLEALVRVVDELATNVGDAGAGRGGHLGTGGKAMTTHVMRSLLVAFALVLSPALASAECAWVLWMTAFKMNGDTPVASMASISAAYPTYKECDQNQREMQKEIERKKDGTQRYFTCLPDTVDPRGPKRN